MISKRLLNHLECYTPSYLDIFMEPRSNTDLKMRVVNPSPRLTVVEYVYYQPGDNQPSVVENRYLRDLKSKDQPYRRNYTLTREWVKLDTGWLSEVSCIVISNEEGKSLKIIPTEDEKRLVSEKIIEVALELVTKPPFIDMAPILVIHPTEDSRFTPYSIKDIMIRARVDGVKSIVTLIPA